MTSARAGRAAPEWLRRLGRGLEIALVWWLLASGLRIRGRTVESWYFTGADSYGYCRLGHELGVHHRYALGPPPEPLGWVRPPLYPIFLRAVGAAEVCDLPLDQNIAGWRRAQRAQIWIDVLATGLAIYFLARRMGGPLAGALALALHMVCPPLVLSSGAILVETLATALTALSIAPLALGEKRPRLWFPVGAAFVALSTLLRPDGLLLGVAFAPALLRIRAPRKWRERAIVAALCAGTFAAVFAPWPIRNLYRFGEARPLGGRIDRKTHPVEHYQGFWEWLRAWAPDWKPMTYPTTCFYDLKCRPTVALFDQPEAFESPAQRAAVEKLFARRMSEGVSEGVSRGFLEIANARMRRHPWDARLRLPVKRMWSMWVAPFDELLQGVPPWPRMVAKVRPRLEKWSRWLLEAMILGALILLARRRTRGIASILVVTIGARTAILAWAYYCMPRYALEVMPLGFVLVAAGLAELVRLTAAGVRLGEARIARAVRRGPA